MKTLKDLEKAVVKPEGGAKGVKKFLHFKMAIPSRLDSDKN